MLLPPPYRCTACMFLRGNQQRENKQNNLSIIAHDLQLKRRYSQTIKLFTCCYYRLFVMLRLNWIYCLIDRLSDRPPMSHRSKTVAAIADLQGFRYTLLWQYIYSVTTRINLHPVDAVSIPTFPQEYYLSSFGCNTKRLSEEDPGVQIQEVVLFTLLLLMPRCSCTIISGQCLWEEQAQVCRGRNASRFCRLG